MDEKSGKSLSVFETIGPVSLSGSLRAYLLLLTSEGIGAVSLGIWDTIKFWFYSGLRLTESQRPGVRELSVLKGRDGPLFSTASLQSVCVEYSLFDADFIKIQQSESPDPVTFRLGDKHQTERARSLLRAAFPEQYEERGFS